MIKVAVRHNPALTKETVLERFRAHFAGRYEVYPTRLLGADLVVKKSASTGVSIKLVQKDDATLFRFGAFAPSLGFRLLLYGVVAYFILRPKWRALEQEVRAYIESEPAFR